MSESYILCEGYHDRAFWAGLLIHAGCVDPGIMPGGRRIQVKDAFGDFVKAPAFLFKSNSGRFIRLVPASGKDNIPKLVRIRLEQSIVKPLSRLIVSIDSDQLAGLLVTVGTPFSRQNLIDIARDFDPHMILRTDGDLEISAGRTIVSLVSWQSSDAPLIGLPSQQTLERLICAALIAVYPNRAPAVQNWLDSRPDAPRAGPKEFAWSYLAGWNASVGSYEGFCSMVWKDPKVAVQLRQRLKAAGIWEIAESLAS